MTEYVEAVMVYDNSGNGNIPTAQLVSGNKEEEEKLRKIELFIKDRNKDIVDIKNLCNKITKNMYDLQNVFTSNNNKKNNLLGEKRRLEYRNEVLGTKVFRNRTLLKNTAFGIYICEKRYAELLDIEPKYSSQEEVENEKIINLKKLISEDEKTMNANKEKISQISSKYDKLKKENRNIKEEISKFNKDLSLESKHEYQKKLKISFANRIKDKILYERQAKLFSIPIDMEDKSQEYVDNLKFAVEKKRKEIHKKNSPETYQNFYRGLKTVLKQIIANRIFVEIDTTRFDKQYENYLKQILYKWRENRKKDRDFTNKISVAKWKDYMKIHHVTINSNHDLEKMYENVYGISSGVYDNDVKVHVNTGHVIDRALL